jgi:anti-sigma B factor antagonist
MEELTIEILPGSTPGLRTLKLTGPFTLRTIFEFQEIVRAEPSPHTVIDLTDVPYMDSAALGAILGFHVSCQREKREYVVAGASARLRTLFKVAGVEQLIHLDKPMSEAAGL